MKNRILVPILLLMLSSSALPGEFLISDWKGDRYRISEMKMQTIKDESKFHISLISLVDVKDVEMHVSIVPERIDWRLNLGALVNLESVENRAEKLLPHSGKRERAVVRSIAGKYGYILEGKLHIVSLFLAYDDLDASVANLMTAEEREQVFEVPSEWHDLSVKIHPQIEPAKQKK